MSETLSRVLVGRYVDSVLLMRLSQKLEGLEGVEQAAAMMATQANKKTLAQAGFLIGHATDAKANDLVVAVRARDSTAVLAALGEVDSLLSSRSRGEGLAERPHTLDQALQSHPEVNLALISTPGEYAAAQASHALERGLHVMIFSSNVPVEKEVELKRLAREKGLLCMGPDCGTAIIAGVCLGFANVVRRGPVGVVGASGTGIQVVTCLLDRLGVGVSHAIGCGSRDVSRLVGGLTALQGLDALSSDTGTQAILVISKPPDPDVADTIRNWAARCTKPVVCCFLGDPQGPKTLAEAALEAACAVGRVVSMGDLALPSDAAAASPAPLGPEQKYLRGIFAGGTLAYEAQLVLRCRGFEILSNAPLPGGDTLPDVARSEGHTILDLGSEELTRGRPHPMIDSRLRGERLLQEAQDSQVGVILLDFVLGYGSADDPVGDMVGAITQALSRREKQGMPLNLVASVVGTSKDRQDFVTQVEKLRLAGVHVRGTNDQAAELAASLLPQSAHRPETVLA